MDLIRPIVELYRRMSCELPVDVTAALEAGLTREEKGSVGQDALRTILDNVAVAADAGRPMCQDTGLPVFYVARPREVSERELRDAILEATREATKLASLRPNAVDAITGGNSGDNTGEGFPIIHIQETDGNAVVIDAMLKGGGCENVGERYKLPDSSLGAARDLDGVRRCVLDAVHKAQGRGCPPYVLGVAVGGARDGTAALAKKQLLRKLDDRSSDPELARLEATLTEETNTLGIGPAGFGGRTTVLSVKAAAQHRHCACYFVEVMFGCWAMRRGRLVVDETGARHE